jgi:hypothetical protein
MVSYFCHEGDILIRSNHDHTSDFRTDPVILIDLSVSSVVAFIIGEADQIQIITTERQLNTGRYDLHLFVRLESVVAQFGAKDLVEVFAL